MNVRSVRNKTLYLYDYIATTNSDFVALTETWFNSEEDNDTYINSLLPAGYAIQHADIDNGRRGGGVALIYKNTIKLKRNTTQNFTQFEHTCMKCTATCDNKSIQIIVIYRPPPSQQNKFSNLTTSIPVV